MLQIKDSIAEIMLPFFGGVLLLILLFLESVDWCSFILGLFDEKSLSYT